MIVPFGEDEGVLGDEMECTNASPKVKIGDWTRNSLESL